jgi:membrane fusion protein, multidrug efflux system
MSDQHDLGFALPPPARSSRVRVVLVLGVVLAGAFAFGYVRHRQAQGDVPISTETRVLRVEVMKASSTASSGALDLPGTVRPLEETKLYPRVTGYVRTWLVDIGDKVQAGQLLAEIETPDLDAQLAQARAQLGQARASVRQAAAQSKYSRSNSARYKTLSEQQLVSKDQVEQTKAQAQTDQANVSAAYSSVAAHVANVQRLTELADFAKVTAPFAGTITTRTIDRGALVTEGNQTPMFTVVAIDPVRVLVEVPQTLAASIKVGTEATITAREYAGKKFTGAVTRAAGALDPESHTMTTEIRVPNPEGTLMPGMYVQVQLAVTARHILEIPSTALYNDAQGLRVAIVDAQSKIHFVPITIERDTGATLHVATGLTGEERILKLAVPSLVEGATVEVVVPAAPPGKPAGKPAAPAPAPAPTKAATAGAAGAGAAGAAPAAEPASEAAPAKAEAPPAKTEAAPAKAEAPPAKTEAAPAKAEAAPAKPAPPAKPGAKAKAAPVKARAGTAR